MNRVRLTVIALVLPLMCVTSETQSGKISGTLIVNGKKLTIRHVSAVTYELRTWARS